MNRIDLLDDLYNIADDATILFRRLDRLVPDLDGQDRKAIVRLHDTLEAAHNAAMEYLNNPIAE